MDPILGKILSSGLEGASEIVSAVRRKKKKQEAKDFFLKTLGEIDAELNPVPIKTGVRNGQVVTEEGLESGFDNKSPVMTEQQQAPNVSKAMNILYKGLGELGDYGDVGSEYSNLLGSYTKSTLPDYQVIKMGENVVAVDPLRNKFNLLYQGTPEEEGLKNIGQTYPTTDTEGKHKIAIDVYDPGTRSYKTEYVRDMTESEIEQYNRDITQQEAGITQKLRGPRGIKTPKVPETNSPREMLIRTDVDRFAQLKRMKFDQMSKEQKKEYSTLEERIRTETGQDPHGVTNYIYSEEFKEKNKSGQYGDAITERAGIIQDQFNTVGNVFQQIQDALSGGTMTIDQAKEYALQLYNDNINSWYDEVRKYILDTFNEMGITVEE